MPAFPLIVADRGMRNLARSARGLNAAEASRPSCSGAAANRHGPKANPLPALCKRRSDEGPYQREQPQTAAG